MNGRNIWVGKAKPISKTGGAYPSGQVVKKGKVQETQFPAGCGDGGKRVPSGDGGKCVPSGHLREAQNDPKSSTETSVGYGSSLHED